MADLVKTLSGNEYTILDNNDYFQLHPAADGHWLGAKYTRDCTKCCLCLLNENFELLRSSVELPFEIRSIVTDDTCTSVYTIAENDIKRGFKILKLDYKSFKEMKRLQESEGQRHMRFRKACFQNKHLFLMDSHTKTIEMFNSELELKHTLKLDKLDDDVCDMELLNETAFLLSHKRDSIYICNMSGDQINLMKTIHNGNYYSISHVASNLIFFNFTSFSFEFYGDEKLLIKAAGLEKDKKKLGDVYPFNGFKLLRSNNALILSMSGKIVKYLVK